MTNLRNILAGLGVVGSLVGCRDMSKDFSKIEINGGYEFFASFDGSGRNAGINDTAGTFGYAVTGADRNNDGRFDIINLNFVPKGDPIEAYANLDSLESIWNRLAPREEKK